MKSTINHDKHESQPDCAARQGIITRKTSVPVAKSRVLADSPTTFPAKVIMAICLLAAAVFCGGCIDPAGDYQFIVPDTAGATGSEIPVVARLMRREILSIRSSVKQQPIAIQIADGELRAAFTDGSGYASATMTLPEKQGKYPMLISYQDLRGTPGTLEASTWAIEVQATVVVVNFDALDYLQDEDVEQFKKLTSNGIQIVYADRDGDIEMAEAHTAIKAAGLPDGPVLNWQFKKGTATGSLVPLTKQVRKIYYIPSGDRDFTAMAAKLNVEIYAPWGRTQERR